MTPRETAYLAVLAACRGEAYASDRLDRWVAKEHPSSRDLGFARELAYGSIRMALSLDHYAKQLTAKGKLQLKLKEKVLLRLALYQWFYMDRVPLYALADESIQVAKKHCHSRFVSFLNAILRRLEATHLSLPEGDLSIRYSMPKYLVNAFIRDYGREEAEHILQASNLAGVTTARVRAEGFKVVPVTDLQKIAESTDYYIQNATQATLIGELCEHISTPQSILDLCAAPGGKTLAVHDAFPQAHLFANDVSEQKLAKLRQNLDKYGVSVALHCGGGQDYPTDRLFSLVVADLPCSNSGVLNKRPEARWRIDEATVAELLQVQKAILKRGAELVEPGGQLWLMTCSILKDENAALVAYAIDELGLRAGGYQRTIVPNADGWDGGFACQLLKK